MVPIAFKVFLAPAQCVTGLPGCHSGVGIWVRRASLKLWGIPCLAAASWVEERHLAMAEVEPSLLRMSR